MNKKNPLVSIICFTYNHAKFIRKTLEGFVMQKVNFPIEIIIHDDASTDSTQEIIKEFENKHLDIFKPIYQRENQRSKGVGIVSKLVYSKAQGKYIAFCEGDDYWTDPYKLQKQVDFLEANPTYAGCFHYTQQVFTKHPDKQGRIYGKHGKQLDFTAEDTIARLSPWHTSSFIFRNEAFEKPDWLYNVVSGDMALFSIVAKSGNIKCIPEIMSVYQKHDGGITQTKAHNHEDYHNNRIALIQHLDAYHEFKYHKKAQEVINFHTNAINHPNSNKKSIFGRVINRLKRLTK